MPLEATARDQRDRAAKAGHGIAEEQRLLDRIPRRGRLWLAVALGAILALAVWLLLGRGAEKPASVTATVTRGNIERTVLATGVLEPSRLVNVGAQASGQVRKLYVELGDTVKSGDLIAEIDNRTQSNTVSNAQTALANARAQRSSAAANLNEARLNFERQQRLYAEGASAKAAFEAAEANLANARASLAAADAQIKQASLQLSTAETNLGYTRIVAPTDGTIVAIVTEEGQTVNANQSAPTIVMLAQLDRMTVSAEISEADVEKVLPGQTVYFTTLGNPAERRYAELRAIAPAPESIEREAQTASATTSAVYYNGLFDVDNEDGRLKTGMTAQVYIVLESVRNALTVPASALQRSDKGEGYSVAVVGKDGKTELRRVKTGINNNVMAEVLEGLREGEQVVVAQAAGPATPTRQTRNPVMFGGPPRGGPP